MQSSDFPRMVSSVSSPNTLGSSSEGAYSSQLLMLVSFPSHSPMAPLPPASVQSGRGVSVQGGSYSSNSYNSHIL